MLKPDSLRAALTAAVPALRTDPDRLSLFIEKGGIAATATPGLAFEYRYTLQLLILDFAGHPDQVFVPLLAWLRVHQNDLLADPAKRESLRFEAEMIDKDRVDLSIEVPLTERVTVAARADGGYDITHRPEPMIEPGYDFTPGAEIRLWRLFAGGDELLRWEAPNAVVVPPQ